MPINTVIFDLGGVLVWTEWERFTGPVAEMTTVEREHRSLVHPLSVDLNGKRVPQLDREGIELLKRLPGQSSLSAERRRALLHDTLEPMVQRELHHRGLIPENGGYSAKLIGWVEVGIESPTPS